MLKQVTAGLFKSLSAVCLCLMLTHQAGAMPFIIWSGVQDIEVPWFASDTMLDIDANGVDDFMIRNQGSFTILAYSLVDGNEFFCTINEDPKYPPAAHPESAGTLFDDAPINPNVWDNNESDSQIMMEFGNGYWAGTDHEYMGVRFYDDAALFYGWVEMSIDGDTPHSMTIHSWAYNSQPGAGLVAGVVPEPSTWALFLCGGIALLFRLRKRCVTKSTPLFLQRS